MKYRKAIVTYMDVLGFSELVESASAEIVNRKLNAAWENTKPLFEGGDDLLQDLLPKVFQFSDSIVRVKFTDSTGNRKFPVGLFCNEIRELVFAQVNLIKEGVLLRGGIAYGNICIGNQSVFGSAYIEAYEMEHMYALYPRIALSPSLISDHIWNPLLRKRGDTAKEEKKHIRDLLRKGDDGIFYIDYARAVESKLADKDKYPQFLIDHRKVIIEGAEKNKQEISILNKYLWLATYHNSIVSMKTAHWFKSYSLRKRDLLITKDEISYLHDLN